MTEGDFPFRSFTMRSEGYDRAEVDGYVDELRSEIVELRRALETASPQGGVGGDTRLHDPEGAVTRTLAIAQETADRVMHDAQVEADRRRAEADEHSTTTMADADERAARLLSDMEAQAAEVREQGVAAARSAIQVERDKAMAELAHVRRVRDDLRSEAVDLKSALDTYRSQAREASDTLAAASSGPLMGVELPDFIDDDVVLAGIVEEGEIDELEPDYDDFVAEVEPAPLFEDDNIEYAAEADDIDADQVYESDSDGADSDTELDDTELDNTELDDTDAVDDADDADHETTHLRPVGDYEPEPVFADDADFYDDDADDAGNDADSETGLADVIAIGSEVDYDDSLPSDLDQSDLTDEADDGGSGTFLAEVRAAAEDDVVLAPENDDSDRFLSELRGITSDDDGDIDGDAADKFFD